MHRCCKPEMATTMQRIVAHDEMGGVVHCGEASGLSRS